MARENEKHHFTVLNSASDLSGERPARAYVSWGDPAFNSGVFERGADGVGDLPIVSGVRDKDLMGHIKG